MERHIVESIIKYVDFLRLDQKLQVSFCNLSGSFNSYMHILYPYNYHINSFCNSIKSNDYAKNVCVIKQQRVKEKCKDGAFFGCCWAGMQEYVFPIEHDGTVLGFISVSGFRKDVNVSLERIRSVSEKYHLNEKDLIEKFYESTTECDNDFSKLKALINPLCIMFDYLYVEFNRSNVKPAKYSEYVSLYQKILDLVCSNYTDIISVEKVAKILNYSPTYISKLFYKNSGCHLSEYIISLKMKKATELLTNSSLAVSQIAYNVGFPDSNYFSTKFKQETGKSPSEYRKSVTKDKKYN